jgi:hypothetical protein
MIIDSNVERRMRLKNATQHAAKTFGDVQLCSDFYVATDRLKHSKDRVVVFMSEDFAGASLNAFIDIAKTTCAGRDSAYILNVGQRHANPSSVINAGLKAIDGMLVEPFCVDSLITTTESAARLYYERKQEREHGLVKMLVSRMLVAIDTIATAKATCSAAGEAVRDYKDLGATIQNLSPKLVSFFYEMLIEQSALAQVPADLEAFMVRKAMRALLSEDSVEQTVSEHRPTQPQPSSSYMGRFIRRK